MSKQDRQGVRTAADLERKYGFGQSFAEVYGLANDAQQTANEAKDAVSNFDESLTSEEILLRLTGGGRDQGVYRDGEKVLINADCIMSGKVKAEHIEAEKLKVKSANIDGKLTADQIDATFLQVDSGEVQDLTAGFVRILDLLSIYGTDYYGNQSLDGHIGSLAGNTGLHGAALLDGTANNYLIATDGGARMSAYGQAELYVFYNAATGNLGAGSSCSFTNGSDRRLKNTIVYGLDEYEELFKKLKPCSFAYNKEKNGGRHWGLVAQDVLQSAEESELDKPIALVADTGKYYGIAYGELSALNTHMIQKLMNRVEELEKKVAELGGETNG